MRKISYRIGLVIALLAAWAAGCGSDLPAFSPPLLMDKAGLGERIPLATDALGPDGQAQVDFPDGARFQAHVVGVSEGAVLAPWLSPERSAGLALYGPRRPDGLFGLALASDATSGGGRASLAPRALAAGDYLLLVADLSDRAGGYTLRAACQDNCEQPTCTPQTFGDYCATGLAHDEQGCPKNECGPVCSEENPCPAGFVCQAGLCEPESGCDDCRDHPYEPVCGVDGQTYANSCEMEACNSGVELAHEGPCEVPGCSSDADCPAGMRCEAGVCTEACDCDAVPTDPVCGIDGLTYPNDCQRQCAGVGLAHQGSCVSCNPEICDGRDNDCDGLIDEGCFVDCASDADCPAGQVCAAGQCSATLPCATHADCPADQICTDGLCRPDQECVAEICDGLDNDCDGLVDEDFDLLSDPANCGVCGQACDPDETCLNGACTAAACQTDADCPAGQLCVNNQCEPGCRTDADCPAGQVCDAASGQCVPACQTNADCAAGQICVDGLCIDGCASDADCEADEVCVDGLCEPDGCDTDADGDGYLAEICGGTDCDDRDPTVNPGAPEICNGLDDDCDGQVDEQGCPQPCASDADCLAGQLCVAGNCLMGCATDADCQAAEVCLMGACVVPCATDADCPAGWTCNVGERICQP